MPDTFDPKFGSPAQFVFLVDNITASQTDVDLTARTGFTTVTMPSAGSVVAVTVQSSANFTAGVATVRAHSASTEFADSGYPAAVLNSTNSNSQYAVVRPGAIRFAAGAKLGLSYTSDANIAPTNTNDLTAVLHVVFDPI